MLILFWQSIFHSIQNSDEIVVNYFNKILKLRKSRETVSQIALAIVYCVLFYTCVFMEKYSLFETSFEFLSCCF